MSFPYSSDQLQAQPAFSWKVQQFQTPQTYSEKLAGTPTWSTQSRASQEPVQRASSSKPHVRSDPSSKSLAGVGVGLQPSKKRRKLNEEEDRLLQIVSWMIDSNTRLGEPYRVLWARRRKFVQSIHPIACLEEEVGFVFSVWCWTSWRTNWVKL